MREEFILINTYTYIRIITKKLNRLYLQKILVLCGIKKIVIESNLLEVGARDPGS
jgi:hypothetical protein